MTTKAKMKKFILGAIVFIIGSIVLALIKTFDIQMGAIPAFIFMLVFLTIFFKVIR